MNAADRDREAFIAELERQHRDIEDHGDGTVTMIAGCTPRSSSFVLNVDDLISSVVPAARAQAGEPVAQEHVQHECVCGHRWMAPMHPDQNCPACNPVHAPAQEPVAVPADVVRLVLAARDVAFTSDPTPEALKELDAASEAFADRVPWDDEPLPYEPDAAPVSPAADSGEDDGLPLLPLKERVIGTISYHTSALQPQPGGAVKVTGADLQAIGDALEGCDWLGTGSDSKAAAAERDQVMAAWGRIASALSPSPSGWDAGAELENLRALLAEIYEWQAGSTILPISIWKKLRAAIPLPTPPAGEG